MGRRIAALVAVLALSALLVGCADGASKSPADNATGTKQIVTSRGEGLASGKPDQAQISFAVNSKQPKAADALDMVARATKTMTDAIIKAGVPKEDLQTSGVSLYPDYAPGKDNTPKISGYRAQIRITAKVKDLAKLGDVLTIATEAGATEISGPTFTLSDDSTVRDEAVANAVKDARQAAEAIAKASDRKLGKLLQVTQADTSANRSDWNYAGVASSYSLLRADAVPIEPGELDVTSKVTVIFAFE